MGGFSTLNEGATALDPFVSAVPQPLAWFDSDLHCRWANAAYAQLSRRDTDQIVGLHLLETQPHLTSEWLERLQDALDNEVTFTENAVVDRGSGVPHHWELTYFSVPSRRGRPATVGVTATEVTSYASQVDQLVVRASLDPLTGLPHHGELLDRLTKTLERSAVRRLGLAGTGSYLIFGDVEDFKSVNDTYGRHVGDEVLAVIATRLRGSQRADDTVARLGGDVFAILCEGSTLAGAIKASERAKSAVTEPIAIGGKIVQVSVTMGLLRADREESAQDVLDQVYKAMLASKQARRQLRPSDLTSDLPPDDDGGGLAAAGFIRALESRAVIEQAIGVLMAILRCSADEARSELAAASQQHDLSARQLAAGLIELLSPQETAMRRAADTGPQELATTQAILQMWGDSLPVQPHEGQTAGPEGPHR